MFARVPDPTASAAERRTRVSLALLPGAVLGLAIEAENAGRRRSSTRWPSAPPASARRAAQPAIVQRALRPVEDRLWHWNEVARREQTRNQAQASALIPVIVQQVTENVIAQIDFVRVVEQIPVDDIAGAIDVEAIVQRIDLGGVIRESTMGLTTEAIDAVRIAGDRRSTGRSRVWSTGSCSAGRERDVRAGAVVSREQIRHQRSLDVQGKRAGFASQAVAMALDILSVGGLLLRVSSSSTDAVRFVLTDSAFEMPQPGTARERHSRLRVRLVRARGRVVGRRAARRAWRSSACGW